MFCPKCGTQVPDGVKFCPTCGNLMQAAPQEPAPQVQEPVYQEPAPQVQEPVYQQPVYQQPVYQEPAPTPAYNNIYQEPAPQPQYNAAPVDDNGASTPILILGIVGLATSFLPYLVSIVGIIISAIARGKAKNYKATFGELFGKAKVGANLAKAGLIISIIMTILWFIIIIILIILAALGNADWGDIYNSIY